MVFCTLCDRVCVEASLPREVVFRLDCVACRYGCETVRQHLHVQSVSFWAPANIGPYSQAVLVSIICVQDLHVCFDTAAPC